MHKSALIVGVIVAVGSLAACKQGADKSGNEAAQSVTKDGASSKTMAAGLPANGKFMTAAKAVGLDQTLAGKDSYTVLVPDDAAFAKLPDDWTKPEARAQVTGILTYHILPGVVLADDIGKAIDNSKGKAVLATMSGQTLTATREGGKIVLTDGAGNKATIGKADEQYSNGVVHHIDALLSPAKDDQPA